MDIVIVKKIPMKKSSKGNYEKTRKLLDRFLDSGKKRGAISEPSYTKERINALYRKLYFTVYTSKEKYPIKVQVKKNTIFLTRTDLI